MFTRFESVWYLCHTCCVSVSVCTIMWCVHFTRVLCLWYAEKCLKIILYQIHVTLKILWMLVWYFFFNSALTADESCFLRKIIQIAPRESQIGGNVLNMFIFNMQLKVLIFLVIINWQQYVLAVYTCIQSIPKYIWYTYSFSFSIQLKRTKIMVIWNEILTPKNTYDQVSID